ncbi:MAG: S26 family signal peptidase, partial [Panacagrimonas sp.]
RSHRHGTPPPGGSADGAGRASAMNAGNATALPGMDESALRAIRIAKNRRFIVGLVAWAVAASLLLLGARPWGRLAFNGSDSLPGFLYVIRVGELPQRDQLVAFYPPRNRFYREGMFFVKQVKGVSGDRIERRDAEFFVNGQHLATAKARSLKGQPLQPGPEGVLPDGNLWVWTPHPDSFDSRYADVGWIAPDRVLGRAYRLL